MLISNTWGPALFEVGICKTTASLASALFGVTFTTCLVNIHRAGDSNEKFYRKLCLKIFMYFYILYFSTFVIARSKSFYLWITYGIVSDDGTLTIILRIDMQSAGPLAGMAALETIGNPRRHKNSISVSINSVRGVAVATNAYRTCSRRGRLWKSWTALKARHARRYSLTGSSFVSRRFIC